MLIGNNRPSLRGPCRAQRAYALAERIDITIDGNLRLPRVQAYRLAFHDGACVLQVFIESLRGRGGAALHGIDRRQARDKRFEIGARDRTATAIHDRPSYAVSLDPWRVDDVRKIQVVVILDALHHDMRRQARRQTDEVTQ